MCRLIGQPQRSSLRPLITSHPLPPPLPSRPRPLPLFHPLSACLPARRRYTAIYVGRPSLDEEYVQTELTPNQCRLRDQTYSAPISVDLEYSRGKEVVIRKGKNGAGAVIIGRMPIMLRSDRWAGGRAGARVPRRPALGWSVVARGLQCDGWGAGELAESQMCRFGAGAKGRGFLSLRGTATTATSANLCSRHHPLPLRRLPS